jgi:hypothetical protein
MALPASGQISINDIYTEANNGGCYTPQICLGNPGCFSLNSLATDFGIATDPDSVSEFYGLSCPLLTMQLYHKRNSNSPAYGYNVYWSTDCSTFTQWNGTDCSESDSCTDDGTFTIAVNTNIYVMVEDCNGPTAGLGYNATDDSSTCPGNSINYSCFRDDCSLAFVFNSGYVNKNIALNVYTSKIGYYYA